MIYLLKKIKRKLYELKAWLVRFRRRFILFHKIRKSSKKDGVKEEFKELRSYWAIQQLIDKYDFETVLDIGSGDGQHSDCFLKKGKRVTAIDYGLSRYFQDKKDEMETIVADYNKFEFNEKFDCIWCSHVLEHQPDPHEFLCKIYNDLKEGGVLAITVPPLKFTIVGGHINLFNSGLFIYRLILAGFDCYEARLLEYGNNISVLVQKKTVSNFPQIAYDSGDVGRLKTLFPKPVQHLIKGGDSFNGDIEEINWYK